MYFIMLFISLYACISAFLFCSVLVMGTDMPPWSWYLAFENSEMTVKEIRLITSIL